MLTLSVMNKCIKLWSLIFLFMSLPIFVAAQSVDELKQQADSLYKNFDEQRALELYERVLEKEPENFEALWKSSFLYSRIGNRFEDKGRQEEYFKKGINLAERALAEDSSNTQSNFVMAVAMGRKALISGARSRVAASRDIKKYVDRALKYDSTNAGAWHVLGLWNFKVANLGWLERAAANTLFGGIPGDASNEKAAEAIRKAIELNNQYILYYYDLAQVYRKMGREAQAIKTCQQGIELPLLTPDDAALKNQCQELIEDF